MSFTKQFIEDLHKAFGPYVIEAVESESGIAGRILDDNVETGINYNEILTATSEEFLIEAEKQPTDSATDVYKALVNLVEEKKLRPREVFGYAHYRWCLNKPEAIVAYQTGHDEWSVNNCDTEITEEAALVKICEEWGFETGRTRIIGTPYYDATDYQFIRFNCAHMTWLWQNGSLLQVYC